MPRARTVSLTCLLLLTGATGVGARAEFRIGGPQGNRWTDLVEAGAEASYVVVDTAGNVLRQAPVEVVEEVGGGTFLAEYNYRGLDLPDTTGNILQPQWFDPEVNLARDEVLYGNGGIAQHEIIQILGDGIDGDPETAILNIVHESPFILGHNGSGIGAWAIKFGSEMPVNRIRFYPRPGFEDNYLKWYEIAVGDNSAPKTNYATHNLSAQRPGQHYFKEFAELPSLTETPDPDLEVLFSTRESLDTDTDRRFPVRHLRFVTLRPLNPERTWEVAELEIYGEGYPRRRWWRSQILDFTEPVTLSKIRWEGEQPPGTRLEIRTRTGHTMSPSLFWATGRTGLVERSTFSDWVAERMPPDRRTHAVDNWSFWSPVYDFDAGLRDPTASAQAWSDGTSVLSPGPRRYLQLEIFFHSTQTRAPRLDNVSLLFAETAAAEAVFGEIWPIEVESFEPQMFTYIVRPVLRVGNSGFDRLEIFTGSQADTVRSVRVGGVEFIDRFPPRILPDRLVVQFDRLSDPGGDSEKRIEVTFDTRVLRFGVEFSGWIYASDDLEIRQQIEPGNATYRFSGDDLSVRTPLGGDLLHGLRVSSPVLTPNGDGVNDEIRIGYDIRNLSQPRRVTVQIFDLSGRRVRQVVSAFNTSGSFDDNRWDGRDTAGDFVPPGSYLLRVAVDTDTGVDAATSILSVLY